MGFNGDYRGSINQKTGMLVDIPSGKSTISMAMFNSHVFLNQRVHAIKIDVMKIWIHHMVGW